jgi:Ca2+/Na+ antiporter|uniref:Uncharacterized protein n=1 Tax=viral metagenome TaxID=1070528 RepID=A0A6C0K0X3_9ZZZZ
MPSHETLRIRTPPPDDEEPTIIYVNSHNNIVFMLLLAITLHTTAYVVTSNEMFLWLSVLFGCLGLLMILLTYKKRHSKEDYDSAV